MKMTNDYLHCVDLDSTQVLAHNRVGFFSKRRDLFSLLPEACNSLEDHGVHKVDGALY